MTTPWGTSLPQWSSSTPCCDGHQHGGGTWRGWTRTRADPPHVSFYRAARELGDLQAIEHGPTAYGRRLIRKKAYAKSNGLLAMVLRDIGL